MRETMQTLNFSYEHSQDDLFLFSSHTKSKGSIEIGDIIIDFDSKKNIVGLQIMNATRVLADLVDNGNDVREVLANLSECKIDVKMKNNMLILKIYLTSKAKELSPIISLPCIQKSSPALICA